MNKEELKKVLQLEMDAFTGNHEPMSDLLIDKYLIPIFEKYSNTQNASLLEEIKELKKRIDLNAQYTKGLLDAYTNEIHKPTE